MEGRTTKVGDRLYYAGTPFSSSGYCTVTRVYSNEWYENQFDVKFDDEEAENIIGLMQNSLGHIGDKLSRFHFADEYEVPPRGVCRCGCLQPEWLAHQQTDLVQ